VSDFSASRWSITGPRFGVARLDEVIRGLFWGENVVLTGAPARALGQVARQILAATSGIEDFSYRVIVQAAGQDVAGFDRVIPLSEAAEAITELSGSKPHLLVVFDLRGAAGATGEGWDPATAWALARAILRSQAVGLWIADSSWAAGAEGRQLTDLAQLILDVSADQIRVEKADGRPTGVTGAVLRHSVGAGGELTVTSSPAAARLGSGLRAMRQARGWSQGELAQVAGVSASAISQAERGQHALSLETLLELSARLNTTVDEIVRGYPAGYQVTRADTGRDGPGAAARTLIDDPRLGVRTLLVRVPPHGTAAQGTGGGGRELLLAAQGLLQVVLPSARPVIRPGDSLLVTEGPIISCRNLGDDEALVFWLTLGLPHPAGQ
jgi:transcriptional regulator with XRE-family HTH domain